MKFNYYILFYFHLVCSIFGNEFSSSDEIFISGPKLTITELWLQVEKRSSYSIDFKLHDDKKVKLPINGLVTFSGLIEETKKYYKKEYKENIFITVNSNRILFFNKTTEPIHNLRNNNYKKPINLNKKTKTLTYENLKIKSLDDLTPTPTYLPPKAIQKEYEAQSIPKNTLSFDSKFDDKEAVSPLKPDSNYLLKPGDKIEISVWGEDMTKLLTVRPDGYISYVLIGEVYVIGKTFTKLKSTIEKKLSKFIISPNVSIIGKSFEGNFVSILGAVSKPGRKIVSSTDRVLDVITKANGLKFEEFGNSGGEIANLSGAYLSRNGQLVKINFTKLIYEGDMSQNIPIKINDFIYIPSSVGTPIYATGEVKTPKSIPFRGQPTLIDAITSAGGFNISANKSNIKIVRGGMVKPTIVSFNYPNIIKGIEKNEHLQPGDIIYVPATSLTRIERISNKIIPFLDLIIKSNSAKTSIQDW